MNISQKDEFRYHFAGMAMQGILANSEMMESVQRVSISAQMDWKDALASVSVEFADALIKELDSRDKP